MAINKKLIHFKTKENFNKEVVNKNILDSSIVFIQDTKEIYTHGTFYVTMPQNISAFTNDAGYLNESQVTDKINQLLNQAITQALNTAI